MCNAFCDYLFFFQDNTFLYGMLPPLDHMTIQSNKLFLSHFLFFKDHIGLLATERGFHQTKTTKGCGPRTQSEVSSTDGSHVMSRRLCDVNK